MAWSVDGTKITLTRGDSFACQFPMYVIDDEDPDGELYDLQLGDVVRFAMKGDPDENEPVIEKVLDGYTLILNPEDTEGLDFGTYFYDVYITYASGWRVTYIAKAKFKVGEEEHRRWQ